MESLTNEYERRIFAILDEIDTHGGTTKLIEEGWFQKYISDFAYDTALRKQSGDKTCIGVNKYVDVDEHFDSETHAYDPSTAQRQISRLHEVRRTRDAAQLQALLAQLITSARDDSAKDPGQTLSTFGCS